MHILHLIIEIHYTLYQIIPYALAFSPQLDFKVLYYFHFSNTRTIVRTWEEQKQVEVVVPINC